jgi:pimeloyl-ACP methyl ester carboxylesterase
VVSDASPFDLGTLGQLGAVPGWPGAEAYPPQPMIAQTTAALAAYAAKGRVVQTHVLQGCGHSPYLEHPAQFDAVFHPFLGSA